MKALPRSLRIPCACALVTLCPLLMFADWTTNQPAKWVQLPDETPNGMDVRLYDSTQNPQTLMLADDFLCTEPGLITDVHLWGSFRNDLVPPAAAMSFMVSIWSDIPAGVGGISYSRPGELLWGREADPENVAIRLWTNVVPGEWWYDPVEGPPIPEADTQIWQVNLLFDPETAFEQQGTPDQPVVYWVGIQAFIQSPDVYAFGWKTSTNHWNDDAVWTLDPLQGWNELRYPAPHPYEEQSIDLAFVITSEEEVPDRDFGDAPDSVQTPGYPTLLVNSGAWHTIVPGVTLGMLIDPELDGQPNATASGDDLANLDDEDGMVVLGAPAVNGTATVSVSCSVSGFLTAWVDFNADRVWGPTEKIFNAQPVVAGVNLLPFAVPGGAAATNTFARFRFTTSSASLSPGGGAPDGEVEDEPITIVEQEPDTDFGDAPDSPVLPGYPTLLVNNGARHRLVPGVFLGALIDPEPEGQPTINSDGDDLGGLDDEDGVGLPPVMTAGLATSVTVTASVPGFLNAWIDWNANGTWVDPGEHVFINTALVPGLNVLPLNVPVPPVLVPGGPHSRWRFTTYPSAAPAFTGAEQDGEVEDYEVRLEVLDFGDAPDPVYPTLLASGGAAHRIPSAYWLGSAPDLEPDGQPDALAGGDDADGNDDEDGVSPTAPLVRGMAATFRVTASTGGFLNAWLDMNANGSWLDPGDQIATNLLLVPGINLVTVVPPVGAALGPTYARFRFSSLTGLPPTGLAQDGEVEDYRVNLLQAPPLSLVITNLVEAGGTNRVSWSWESNRTYQLQGLGNLMVPTNQTWSNIGGQVDAPVHHQVDPHPNATERFYRVIAPWTP